MDDRKFEQLLERLMKLDFSAGTEAFRDELLKRCLAELEATGDVVQLSDNQLEMLAAAGDAFARAPISFEQDGSFGDNTEGNRLP